MRESAFENSRNYVPQTRGIGFKPQPETRFTCPRCGSLTRASSGLLVRNPVTFERETICRATACKGAR